MCHIYDMFVHKFFFLIFCVLDIIGEVMNAEPLKYMIAKGKFLTKLKLIIRDNVNFIQSLI